MSKEQHQRVIDKCIHSESRLLGLENTLDGIYKFYQCRLNPTASQAYGMCKYNSNAKGISICHYRDMCGQGVDN